MSEPAKQESERGSAFVVSIIVLFLLTSFSSAIILASVHGNRAGEASGENLQALYNAEAGMHMAILELRTSIDYDTDPPSLLDESNPYLGETSGYYGGGTYTVTRTDIDATTIKLESVGKYDTSSDTSTRTIEVISRREIINFNPFTKAAFGDSNINLQGNAMTDSYDSELSSYDDQAVNHHSESGLDYAETNGDVGSNMDIDMIGNAIIFGDANPGPSGAVSTSGNADVTGSRDSMPEEVYNGVPDYAPPGSDPPTYNKSGNQTDTWSDGTYHFSQLSLNGNVVVTLTGDVIVYIDGLIKIDGNAEINLSAGATLTIHHGSGNVKITGNGMVNTDHSPPDLKIYSSSTEEFKIAGNGEFFGSVYAPAAPVKLTGNADSYGSFIGKTFFNSGNSEIHYDEALGRLDDESETFGQFEIFCWREVLP